MTEVFEDAYQGYYMAGEIMPEHDQNVIMEAIEEAEVQAILAELFKPASEEDNVEENDFSGCGGFDCATCPSILAYLM